MAYSTAQLITLVRTHLDDLVEPYLTSDETILEALNRAQQEFVEHTLCLQDSRQFKLNLTAGDEWAYIDPQVMQIRRGIMSTGTRTYVLAASGNEAGEEVAIVATSIASHTPTSGTLSITVGDTTTQYAYTSWTGSTFTLSSALVEDSNDASLVGPTGSSNAILMPTTLADMEAGIGQARDYGFTSTDWRDATGVPQYIITDMDTEFVRIYPIPQANDQVQLECYIYPDVIDDTDVEPMIPERWRMYLVAGALSHLYAIQDAELLDPEQQGFWQQRWMLELTKAQSQMNRNQRGPGTVKMSQQGVW